MQSTLPPYHKYHQLFLLVYDELLETFDWSDHYGWQLPEDTTTDRTANKINKNNLGSDLAWEKASAMVAILLVFDPNPSFANELRQNGDSLGGIGWAMTEFGWDVKYASAPGSVYRHLFPA
ncbi:hypothetical protein NE237_030585 [Protea cynaroides]|uniref:cellulase n=1 Tax=Protea cynaroides TaxID=273540 RepID=A0A9Q0GW87_9MAGN|nr:hypothetical protein NE237_030585 [Protea cynaroides]